MVVEFFNSLLFLHYIYFRLIFEALFKILMWVLSTSNAKFKLINIRREEHLGLKKRCIRINDEEKFDQNLEQKEMKLVLFDLIEVILEFQTLIGDVRRMFKIKQD